MAVAERIPLSAMSFLKSFGLVLTSIPLFYTLAVLFGAPFLSHFEDTFVFALVLSLFTALPLVLTCGSDTEGISELVFDAHASTKAQWISYRVATGACAGALLSTIVIPLDWDVWYQKWPTPCLMGIPAGSFIGFIVAKLEVRMGSWRRAQQKHFKIV